MGETVRRGGAWAIAFLLVVALLGGQALATATAPPQYSSTGRTMGRTGFAYLTGLRTFVAATLWNRIDPLFHSYYRGIPLERQRYMLPSLRIVTWLDPQFVNAYSIASWVVFQGMDRTKGIAIAREGLANNPNSGTMAANLAQLLFIDGFDKHKGELRVLSKQVLSHSALWTDKEARFEGIAVVRDYFAKVGDKAASAELDAELARLRLQGIGQGDHDHNADGKQDH
jgi:hypothetical protein